MRTMTTNRKAALPLIAVLCLIAIAGAAHASAQSHPPANRANQPFVGAWHLAWLEQPGPDGKPHRITCCGSFIFTADGHISVQVMDHDPQQAPGANQYSQNGYEASWGTYTVDPHAHTFTFHVEGALVRTLIGQDLPRRYQFSGKQLIVQSTHADEHWRVAWQRY